MSNDTTNINDLLTDPVGNTNNSNLSMVATENQLIQQPVSNLQPNINLNNQQNNVIPNNLPNNTPNKDSTISPVKGVNLDESTIYQIVNGLQQAGATGVTKLPSRDIPMDPSMISNDVQIQPNYVPPPSKNYIQEDENPQDMINNYHQNQNRNDSIEDFYNEIKIPLLLSIIYFIFQLPFLRKFLFGNMPFLFNIDGNFNFKGLLFKSVLYGLVYYCLCKFTKTFSRF